MRSRLITITVSAAVLGGLLIIPQALAGAPPVTVDIAVSCTQPEGTHQFVFTITNNTDGDIEIDDNSNPEDNPDDARFVVNGGDPEEVNFQNHNLTPGFSQASQPLLLLPSVPSGTGVFTARYTTTGGGQVLGTVTGTIAFEACSGGSTTTTTPTTPTTDPPAVAPVVAAPTFTG